MRDIEPNRRPAAGRIGRIQLGFAASGRPKAERFRLLAQQTPENLPQGGAATGESTPVAGPHKPRRPRFLVRVEHLELGPWLDSLDLGLSVEPGVQLDQPRPNFTRRERRPPGAGLPFEQDWARASLAPGTNDSIA